jgi:hypothetical protein
MDKSTKIVIGVITFIIIIFLLNGFVGTMHGKAWYWPFGESKDEVSSTPSTISFETDGAQDDIEPSTGEEEIKLLTDEDFFYIGENYNCISICGKEITSSKGIPLGPAISVIAKSNEAIGKCCTDKYGGGGCVTVEQLANCMA